MKTTSFSIRLTEQQAIKIKALAASSGMTKSEVVKALVEGHQLTPKTAPGEAGLPPQNLAEIEGVLSDLQGEFSGLVDAVAARLEAIENTLSERLASLSEIRRQQTQIVELLAAQKSPPQAVAVHPPGGAVPAQPVAQGVAPAGGGDDEPFPFSEFMKDRPHNGPPQHLLSHQQYWAGKYQKAFGVWPAEVPKPD